MIKARAIAMRVAVVYAVVASGWILVSGWFALTLPQPLAGQVELTKGLLFVAVTSFALFFAIRMWAERYTLEARHAAGAERVLTQVINTVPVGVILTNDDGEITFLNPAAEDLLGAEAPECVGSSLAQMCTGGGDEGIVGIGELLRTGSADALELTPHAGVEPHSVVARAAQIDSGASGSGWVVAIADITDTHRASRRHERLSRGYRVVSEVAHSLQRATDEEKLLSQLCELLISRGGFRAAWATLADPATGTMRTVAHQGLGAHAMEAAQAMVAAYSSTTSWMPAALAADEVFVKNDLQRDPVSPWSAAAVAEGFGSSASFSCGGPRSVIGTVTLLAAEPGFFDSDQVALLKMLRDDVSFALEKVALDSKRLEAEEMLEKSEATYRELFEKHPQPMLVADRDTLKYLAANEAAQRKYGYTAEEFTRLSVYDIRPAEERPQLEQLVKRERPTFEDIGVWTHRDRSGRDFPVQIWVHTISWLGRPADLVMVQEVAMLH